MLVDRRRWETKIYRATIDLDEPEDDVDRGIAWTVEHLGDKDVTIASGGATRAKDVASDLLPCIAQTNGGSR